MILYVSWVRRVYTYERKEGEYKGSDTDNSAGIKLRQVLDVGQKIRTGLGIKVIHY